MIGVQFDITLFVVAVLGAVVSVGMALTRQVLLYTARSRLAAAEAGVKEAQKTLDAMTEAHKSVQERLRVAEADIRIVQTQLGELAKRQKAALADNYLVVHELGEPGFKRRLYTSSLSLGAMITVGQATSKDSLLRGARHIIEIWAETEAEAVAMARRAYAPEAGYYVSKPIPSLPAASPANAATGAQSGAAVAAA